MLDKLNEKLTEISEAKNTVQQQVLSLKKQTEQATANLNAFIGAEQVLLQLISEIQNEEANADETDKD